METLTIDKLRKNIRFVINKNNSGKGVFDIIPGQCEILDIDYERNAQGKRIMSKPKKDENGHPVYINTLIRYSPGQQSIYADEQDKNARPTNITFEDRQKIVNINEYNLLSYLRKAGYNGNVDPDLRLPGTTVLYSEFDPEKRAKEVIDRDTKKYDAIKKVMEMDFDEQKATLIVFGENPAQYGRVSNMSPSEIKHNVMRLAEYDPDKFLNMLDLKVTKYKYILSKALGLNVITISGNKILNGDNPNEVLYEAPDANRVIGSLADRATGSSDHEAIIDKIEDRITPKENEQNDINIGDVFDVAEHKDIITKNGSWYIFKHDDIEIKAIGKNQFIEKLKDNRDAFEKLIELSQ